MNIKKTALVGALILTIGVMAFVACDKENNTASVDKVTTTYNQTKVASPYSIFNVTKGIKTTTYAGPVICLGNAGICFMEYEHILTDEPWNYIPKGNEGIFAAVQLRPNNVLRTIVHYGYASSEEKSAWEDLIKDGEVPVSEGAWIDDPEIIKNWNLNGAIELVDGSYEVIDYDTNSDYIIIDIPFVYQK